MANWGGFHEWKVGWLQVERMRKVRSENQRDSELVVNRKDTVW